MKVEPCCIGMQVYINHDPDYVYYYDDKLVIFGPPDISDEEDCTGNTYAISEQFNITFCPFCGKKLAK